MIFLGICGYFVGVFCGLVRAANISSSTLVEVFRDDFNKDGGIDLTKWNVANLSSAVNNELQFYTLEDVTVKGGNLNIQSERRQMADRNYTSGRVDTQNKFDFQYGEVEWRARLPKGKGIWTALWLSHPKCPAALPCADFWPPAFSVVDFRGDLPTKVYSTVFYRSATAGIQSVPKTYLAPVDLSLDYHIYRLVWTKDSLISYVDSVEVLRVSEEEKIPQTRMQIVMNVAVGGDFPGLPDNSTVFPTDCLIDYVVVRQTKDGVGYTSTATGVPGYVAPLAGTLGALALLSAVTLFIWIQIKKRRLYMGNMRRESETGSMDSDSTLSTMLYVKTGNASFDILLKKYVSLLEISPENLQLSDKVLGKGEFGIVYKGVAHGLRGVSKTTTVAVKMLLQTHHLDADEQRQLGEEIRVMTKLGRHLNVVNLLGIVIKGSPFLVLEYCPYGSLLSYVKMHRGAYFYDHVDHDGNLLPFDELEETKVLADAKQISGRRESFPEENFDGLVMSTKDLLSFAFQISRGMEYLVSRSIIHRDLAARNVLVAEKKVVKISDFGMARQRQSVYVLENDQASLPVKWMPPEAIVSKTFSQKSDVWSYGILLWEIFSLGEMPYIGSGASGSLNDFVAWLSEGHQMERPSAAPLEIDSLLRLCWKLRTADRPTFTELRENLDKLISVDVTESYLALDEPYQHFNKLNEDILNNMAFVEDEYIKTKSKEENVSSARASPNLYMETFLGP